MDIERPIIRGRKLEQLHLDLGQDSAGLQRCKTCGMLFDRTSEDLVRHKRFCLSKTELSLKEAWSALEQRCKTVKPSRSVTFPTARFVVLPLCDTLQRVMLALVDRCVQPTEQLMAILSRVGQPLLVAVCRPSPVDQLVSIENHVKPANGDREGSPSPIDPDEKTSIVLKHKSFLLTISALAVPPKVAPCPSFFPRPIFVDSQTVTTDDALTLLLDSAVYGVRCQPHSILFSPTAAQHSVVRKLFDTLSSYPHTVSS